MRTIFFIYQRAAGEQLAEDALRAAFGDTLRIASLDDQAESKRASEFDRAGYRIFLRKGVDDSSLDVPKAAGPIMVLLREPTARALEGYRRDLAARGRAHSIEALQAYLANDAIATVDFWRKWSAAPRSIVLRGEDLATNARETLEAVFTAAGVQADETALARAVESASAGGQSEVSLRTLEADPDFLRPYFAEYMNLLADEADYLGYPVWQDRKPAAGPVTTIYRSQRALAEGRFEDVLGVLGSFVAVNGALPEIRAMLGKALLESGREVEGRRALDGIVKAHPDYFDAFGVLVRHAYRLGLSLEVRGLLREAMAREGGPAWACGFLEKTRIDPGLLGEFPKRSEPPVGRGAVVAGFSWILGRPPESDAVIEVHRSLHDDDELRASLLRSQEFREFHERFAAGFEHPPEHGEEVTREDLMQAVRWLLGRPLLSREEADDLLATPSRAALRLRLVGTEEFAQSYRPIAENI